MPHSSPNTAGRGLELLCQGQANPYNRCRKEGGVNFIALIPQNSFQGEILSSRCHTQCRLMAGNREGSRISAANYTSSSLFWSFSHKLDLFSSGRTFKKMLHSAAIGRFWKKEDATRVTSIHQLWATGCPAGEAIWLACFECEERRVCPIQFQNQV